MSGLQNQIVFLIQSYQGAAESSTKTTWSENIKNSVLKMLWYLQELNQVSNKVERCGEKAGVVWSYRFIKDKCSKVCFNKQEFKEFNNEEVKMFEEEVKYFLHESADVASMTNSINGLKPGAAHILAEEMMSIVHDYSWERNHVFSPVRVTKRSKSLKKFSSKRLSKTNSSSSINSVFNKEREKVGGNYVVVVSPIPQTQQEIDEYFEWHVNGMKHLKQKLMPPQLAAHFCDRHNIKLLWLETKVAGYQKPSDNSAGFNMFESFLHSVGGNVISHELLKDIQSNDLVQSVVPVSSVLSHCVKPKSQTKKLMHKEIPICLPKNHQISEVICNIKIAKSAETNAKSELEKVAFGEEICEKCAEKSQVKLFANITSFISLVELQRHRLNRTSDCVAVTWCRFNVENTSELSRKFFDQFTKKKFACSFHIISQCLTCNTYRDRNAGMNATCLIFSKVNENLSAIFLYKSSLYVPAISIPDFVTNLWKLPASDEQVLNQSTLSRMHQQTSETWHDYTQTNVSNLIDKKQQSSSRKNHQVGCKNMLKLLQENYKEERNSAKKKRDSTGSITSLKKTPVAAKGSDFLSDESMIETLKCDYDRNLLQLPDGNFITQCTDTCSGLIDIAQNISTVITHRCRDAVKNGMTGCEKASCLIRKHFLHPIANLRKKKLTEPALTVANECVVQILLRLEAHALNHDEDIDSDELSSFLRLFSLCTSPVAMTNLLNTVLLDGYSATCGQLLHDIYNDLLQPLPPQLQAYSQECDDTFAGMPSVQSVLSSAASSNPPSCSSAPGSSGVRRRSLRMPSFHGPAISRQIVIPGLKNTNKSTANNELNKESNQGIKNRLRNSAKKLKNFVSKNTNDPPVKVCRDLFSNLSSKNPFEFTAKTMDKEESSDNNRRRSLVSDTPDYKQKYTALRRQKLRDIHDTRRSSGKFADIKTIEESPAKDDHVRRSPRHSVMLRRRPSFYNSRRESRSITRAKIITHHNEGVVATPKAIKGRPSLSSGLLFSNKKDAVVEESPEQESNEFVFIDESTRDCNVMDSPAKNTRSHVVNRLLFKTPQKPALQSPRKTTVSMPDSVVEGNCMLNDICVSTDDHEHGLGVAPLLPSPMKTPNKSSMHIRFVTPDKSKQSSVTAKTPVKNTPKSLKLPFAIKTPKFELPNINEEKRERKSKPKNIMASFEPKTPSKDEIRDVKQLSPECDEVVVHGLPSPFKPHVAKKRKWSSATDKTPTRDDIKHWPKKKRGSDKSSPGVVTKRPKKVDTIKCSPDEGVFIIQDTEEFGVGKIAAPDSTSISTLNYNSAKKSKKLSRHKSVSLKKDHEDLVSDVFEFENSSQDSVFFDTSQKEISDLSNNNKNEFFFPELETENINPCNNFRGGEISSRSIYHLHTSPIVSTSDRHVHKVTRSRKEY